MKRLLIALVALVTTGIVHAESYRIFDVVVKPSFYKKTGSTPLFTDEASFRTVINGEDLSVKHIVLIKLDSNGVGVADQTYPLNYPQSYDALGKPQDFTKRKIGVIVRLEKKPNGRFRFSYECTRLQGWIFYGSEKQFTQPVFQYRPSVTMDGEKMPVGFSPQMLIGIGGWSASSSQTPSPFVDRITEEDTFPHFFYIQQIPDSAFFPQ